MIWEILVEDLPRSYPRFVEIRQVVVEEMLFEVVFHFLALVAILCRGEEQFEQFW